MLWIRTLNPVHKHNEDEGLCQSFIVFSFLFQPYRIFNTWVGDPAKIVLLEQVVKVIKEQNLLSNVQVTGEKLLHGLQNAQVRYSRTGSRSL